ncbi:MAG: glycine zipper domain-containing protein, partial [Candidatus Omnitrophota bacterium]
VMGKAGVGAGIGAAVGAVSGGLIGSQIEKKPQAETTPQQAAQTVTTEQMSVLQIIELTQQGTPDDIIIDKIKKTNSKFNLSAEDINYLQKQRISQKVIDAMMAK